jgi:hypothetical protein
MRVSLLVGRGANRPFPSLRCTGHQVTFGVVPGIRDWGCCSNFAGPELVGTADRAGGSALSRREEFRLRMNPVSVPIG